MHAPPLPRWLIPRLPFFYGWVILACACCAGLSRQGGANATLSVFVAPMTEAFGWSRTAISGAVSLGGVLAALATPVLGRFVDRAGARLVLCLAVLTTGLANLGLSMTGSLAMFYVLFCIARVNFAGPFDIGIYGAVNNWFVARRSIANAIATVGQMAGLVLLPMIGSLAMVSGGWPAGWIAIGATVLIVGFVPVFLLMVRRPEDAGLLPDGGAPWPAGPSGLPHAEPAFTRAQAVRTRSFWAISLFTALAYPVQAGVSLHQAPFLIERGLSPTAAASIVSTFSFMSGVSSFGLGLLPRWIGVRWKLVATGTTMCVGTLLYTAVHDTAGGYLAASCFGLGIGGLLLMLPIAWAEYFGRRSYSAIRGIALTVQVVAQASGPLISGVLRDATGGYETSLLCFATLAGSSAMAALLATAPRAR
jgi:MFS family permease